MRFLTTLTVILLSAAPAAAECHRSSSGTFSADVSLSRLSGILCLNDVTVYADQACSGTPSWSVVLGCSESRRMVVTNEGRLVSLMAPRANRREWEIVRVFTFEDDHVEVQSVRLEDLPGLPAGSRRPRMRLDRSMLRVLATPPLTIPVATVHLLGRRTGRR